MKKFISKKPNHKKKGWNSIGGSKVCNPILKFHFFSQPRELRIF
jgi:hypothetical protein